MAEKEEKRERVCKECEIRMESEGWASLVATTTTSKRRLASRSDRPLHYDDFEGDNDALFEFSCPFCYVEYDIGSLCSHLEEEHRFESRSVICPVCAARAGTDVVGHITHQHGHLFKMQRRRRARKSSSSSSASFSLDPLLSSLLCGLSIQESETVSGVAGIEATTKGPLSTDQKSTSLGASFNTQVCEQNMEEAASRAKFVQQMVLSTVFRDD